MLLITLMFLVDFSSNVRAENGIGALANEGISLYRQRRYPEAKIVLEKAISIKKEPDLFYL